MNGFEEFFIVIGRVLIGAMFLWSAFEMARNWNKMKQVLKDKNVPKAEMALPILVGARIIGAASLIFNFLMPIGALILLIVSLPVIFYFHPFWKMQGADHHAKMRAFMSDVIVIGALFLLIGL